MKTTEMTITVLEAAGGEFLTQSNLEEGAERVFTTKAFLAQDSTPADWRSATAAEKDEYERQRKADIC